MLFSARDRGGAKPSSGVTSWGGCWGGVSLLWSARKRSSINETPRSRSSTDGFLTMSADKGASSESSLMTEFWSSPVDPFAVVGGGCFGHFFCVLLRRALFFFSWASRPSVRPSTSFLVIAGVAGKRCEVLFDLYGAERQLFWAKRYRPVPPKAVRPSREMAARASSCLSKPTWRTRVISSALLQRVSGQTCRAKPDADGMDCKARGCVQRSLADISKTHYHWSSRDSEFQKPIRVLITFSPRRGGAQARGQSAPWLAPCLAHPPPSSPVCAGCPFPLPRSSDPPRAPRNSGRSLPRHTSARSPCRQRLRHGPNSMAREGANRREN